MSEIIPPVLYVEDEENDAMLLKLGFKRAGVSHPVHVARDGQQALDYLLGVGNYSDRAKFPIPCLVLLDLNLPKVNGFEVLKRVREQPHFSDLPIIIFTSSEQASDQQRAWSLGATDYCVKPQSISAIGDFARRLGERWLVKCMPVGADATEG